MDAERVTFTGSQGIVLVADVRGDAEAFPVLFLHGGGQTRHAWGGAAERIAGAGWKTITLDLRGHGESEWAPGGDYSMPAFAGDVRAVVEQLGKPAVLVGASLGGISALAAEGAEPKSLSSGLILVDITPMANPVGVDRIKEFMESGMEGFGSLEEAAQAIAAYTPQRKREVNPEGLMKVLRERDGRFYWHWDPAFMKPIKEGGPARRTEGDAAEAMANIRVPTLLVRGMLSDIVTPEGIAALRAGIPHAEVVEVSGAAHMIAGDRNDQFTEAVTRFLEVSVTLPA